MKNKKHPKSFPICAVLDGHTVRAIQLTQDEGEHVALAYAYTPYLSTPPDSRFELGRQLELLQQLLSQPQWGEFLGNHIVLSAPNFFVNEQVHTLAFDRRDQLAQNLLHLNADEKTPLYAHHQPINQHIDSQGSLQTTYLIQYLPAILHHHMADWLAELPWDIRVRSATPALAQDATNDSADTQIIVHMGVLATKIIIWQNGIVAITGVPAGFEHLLKQVMAATNLDRNEAYRLVTHQNHLAGYIGKNLQLAIEQTLIPIAAEISKLVPKPLGPTTQLILAGDGARSPQLLKQLGNTIGVDSLRIYDPWQHLPAYPLRPLPRSVKTSFGPALSLALAEF